MKYIRLITCAVFIITFVVWIGSTLIFSRNADHEGPVIKAKEDRIVVSIADGEDGLKKGLKATDTKDGDLTDQILIGKQSKFIEKGVSQVEYLVFDSNNNVGTYSREVVYEDYTSPEFRLSMPLVYRVGEPIQVLDRLSVYDCIRGDISDKVKIVSSDVDSSKPGVYMMGIEASNQFGDLVSAKVPVSVVEGKYDLSSIELSSYFATVKLGSKDWNPRSYLVSDNEGIQVQSYVDLSNEGCYQVIFSDGSGYTSLVVMVRE